MPSADSSQRASHQTPRHVPGEPGIWVFIFGDMMMFGLFFMIYLYYRAQDLTVYRASQGTLDPRWAVANTFLLIVSSLLVALGVQLVRSNLTRIASHFFIAALLCGCGFCVIKFFEYSAKIEAGITLTTNDFYMFYFMLTGIHLLHLLIGLGLLISMIAATRGIQPKLRYLEGAASFWHLVDLLWIMLFPLLYLLR